MAHKRKPKPTACVVCHRLTIYENAAENHPYGAAWEGKCQQCGAVQTECEWVKDLYALPLDTVVAVQCDRWHAAGRCRCTELHSISLRDLLILNVGVSGYGAYGYSYPYARFQGGCKKCGHFIAGEELLRHNLPILRAFLESIAVGK